MNSPAPLRKLPSLLRNPVSVVGLAVTVVSTVIGLPMMLLDLFSRQTNPYLGAVIYLILPMAASAGAVVAALGALWERRRRRLGREVQPWPTIDLNRPQHQLAVLGALTAVTVLALLLSVTGYRAYHFTESVEFCGLTCHKVMKPEFTAYQYSSHARVACTECHVGAGAESYVRSKLNGLHQVYSLATKRYPRPVPSPVKNLRPAQETCEQCHWPSKFFDAQQKTFSHYLADEANSPWQIQMLLKIGGGDPATGAANGIHWHMNIKNEIQYAAADERREVIPWVRVVEPDGRVTEYQSTEQPMTPEQLAKAQIRRMDCMDCHNRPTHIFHPPDRSVDQSLAAGRMDRSLPYLKREGVRLLAASYESEPEAQQAIVDGLTAFYRQTYPEVFQAREADVRAAAEELQRIFARTIFPEMRTDWRAHPDHVGHLTSNGCFRCHDGLHASADGRVITKDCNACHTILAQGAPEEIAGSPLQAQPFRHPVDVGMDVSELQCSQCHTGTSGL